MRGSEQIDDPRARLAKLEVEVEEMGHELELSRAIAARRQRDIELVRRDMAVLREERDGFRRQLEERNRLLGVILQSGSFRLMQALRRALRRE